jgi:outer membrane protein W
MKTRKIQRFGIGAVLTILTMVTAGSVAMADTGISQGFQGYAAGHLQVGTRMTGFMLLEDTSDSFIGSIDKLNKIENYWPLKLYADWYFTRYWGVELAWDQVKAESATQEKPGDSASHSDGDWVITGPILSVIGRYPNSSHWIPYGGVGLAFMSSTFDHATWWHTGFGSEEDWVANGSPDTTLNGLTRTFEPDNTIGTVAFGGCDYKITDNLLADFYLRYMNASVDTHYFMSMNGSMLDNRGWYSIPLTNVALGLGLAYAF